MASPKLVPLVLSDEERRVLAGWARRRKTAQALALRSRIVLACASGASVTAAAGELQVSRATAAKWRSRFLQDRLEGLSDEPRPGRPRAITDERVEQVIARTLEERGPGEDTHWSTRSMARETGLSQSAVSRIWRAFGLKPHLAIPSGGMDASRENPGRRGSRRAGAAAALQLRFVLRCERAGWDGLVRAARDAGAPWDANPSLSLALGS